MVACIWGSEVPGSVRKWHPSELQTPEGVAQQRQLHLKRWRVRAMQCLQLIRADIVDCTWAYRQAQAWTRQQQLICTAGCVNGR